RSPDFRKAFKRLLCF
nr:Chain A, T345-359 [Meleagris gallopavo]